VRALEERLALARKLYEQSKESGHRHADAWAAKAREYARELDVVRESIQRMDEIAARAGRAQTEAAQ
jgi:hypothetical protein